MLVSELQMYHSGYLTCRQNWKRMIMYYLMLQHADSGNEENMTLYSGRVPCYSIQLYWVRNSRIPEATENSLNTPKHKNPVWPEICFRHKAFRKYFRHEQHSQQYEQFLQVNLPSEPSKIQLLSQMFAFTDWRALKWQPNQAFFCQDIHKLPQHFLLVLIFLFSTL